MEPNNTVDVYYVDDPRNAGGDHRAGGGGAPAPTPIGAIVQRPAAPRPIAMQYAQPVYAQPVAQARPMLFAQAGTWNNQFPGLGRLSLGGALDLVAETIAALWPLPAAPSTTGDIGTDVQNHVLYQTALASHTKRDERIRTLGVVLKRLIG